MEHKFIEYNDSYKKHFKSIFLFIRHFSTIQHFQVEWNVMYAYQKIWNLSHVDLFQVEILCFRCFVITSKLHIFVFLLEKQTVCSQSYLSCLLFRKTKNRNSLVNICTFQLLGDFYIYSNLKIPRFSPNILIYKNSLPSFVNFIFSQLYIDCHTD